MQCHCAPADAFKITQLSVLTGACTLLRTSRLIQQPDGDLISFHWALVRAGNDYRGWNAAKPQGLCLQRVDYPPHSDPRSFVHPDLPHTASGRIASAAPADADADSALES